MLSAPSVSVMIILVQSCLLRHGFISAVGVSLNDCQLVAAASFSGYPSLHPLTLSLFSLLLFPSLHLHLLLPQLICRLFIPCIFLFLYLVVNHLLACLLFFYSLIFHLFHLYFLPFHPSFLICSFSKPLITLSFCLAAPPPPSRPPLISLLASSADSLDLAP